jgi:isohexenylglutaconyl-CoA hydratase
MTNLPETNAIKLELNNEWLTISLNQPEKRNALTEELSREIKETLSAVKDDLSVRGITIRGEGGVFCAGGDLKMFKSGFQGGEQGIKEIQEASEMTGLFFDMINSVPKPVIMLAEGAAMAGGLGMLCTGDIVVVTEDCKFALTETTLGITPAQIAPFVAQRIGLAKARKIMLTASRFTGKEAFEMGLADFLAKDADDLKVIESEIIKGVMKCAPGANAVTKEIVLATRNLNREEMIKFAAKGFAERMLSEEGMEGISSFIEKRKPKWSK